MKKKGSDGRRGEQGKKCIPNQPTHWQEIIIGAIFNVNGCNGLLLHVCACVFACVLMPTRRIAAPAERIYTIIIAFGSAATHQNRLLLLPCCIL